MGQMQRTNLVWDKYIDYLIDAINGSKFMKRAEDKPMSTPKTAKESHVTTRAIHLREASDIAKRLAKGLGLNENYIHAAMLVHDAGHPFSAHEGEEIFNQLGEIYNTQYFHHNAKGIEIILSEDLCGKAIDKIPNIENNPELREKLEEEFPYFLDAVISHDGEATREDMLKSETPYASIKEAVNEKMRSANSQNKYKFIAQTPEGKIAKYADVIAYLSSDMQDGFRLGILEDFSDDYLELFGEMFAQEYPGTREERIDCGRRIIDQIKKQSLREKREVVSRINEDEDMRFSLTVINQKIREQGLRIFEQEDAEKIEAIVEQEQQKFRQRKLSKFFQAQGMSEEQGRVMLESIDSKSVEGTPLEEQEKKLARVLNGINGDANEIEEFTTKMLRARSSVVYEVTSRMKEYFVNDLIKNSQGQDSPQFSNAAWNLFFKAKQLNYKEFVQYTNFAYQTNELPEAARVLAEECADSLIKSGAIRNKFYDRNVKKYIQDPEALEYMQTVYRPEESYTSYRKENGIGDLKSYTKPSSKRFTGTKEQQALMKLKKDIYSYVQNEDEVFAIRYENTFNAIKTRVRRKIEGLVLDPRIEEPKQEQDDKDLENRKKYFQKHLFQKELKAQIDGLRQEVIDRYGSLEITPEQREEYIQAKIQEELDSMERKMALQISTDYLAGMTDKSFMDTAIETGKIDPKILQNATRGDIPSDGVIEIMNKLNSEKKEKTAPTAPSDAGKER